MNQNQSQNKPTPCPNCGYLIDSHRLVGEELDGSPLGTMLKDPVPEAGDVTVCLKCAELFAFAPDLSLRPLTPAEKAITDQDPKVTEIREIIRTEFGFTA